MTAAIPRTGSAGAGSKPFYSSFGFQVLAAGFEWIRRRPISLNARVVANLIGLVMLACLMIAVLTNDVLRYLPR